MSGNKKTNTAVAHKPQIAKVLKPDCDKHSRLCGMHRFAKNNKLITLLDLKDFTVEHLFEPLNTLLKKDIKKLMVLGREYPIESHTPLFQVWTMANQALIEKEDFTAVRIVGLEPTKNAGELKVVLE